MPTVWTTKYLAPLADSFSAPFSPLPAITGCRVFICPYDSLGKEKPSMTLLLVQTVHLTKFICKYVFNYFLSLLRQTFIDYEVALHFYPTLIQGYM